MKKVLSFLISLCMIASLTAVCTFSSAAADDTLVLSMTEAKAEPGKTVDITVNVDQNPGFWSLGIVFYYSDKLTLRDISYSTLTPEEYYFNSEMNVSPDDLGATVREAVDRVGVDTDGLSVVLVFAENEDSIVENITGTGKLLTLSFEVAADAPAGDYVVGATIRDSGDFVDCVTISEVPVEFAGLGKISVSGSTSGGSVNYGTPSNPDAAGSAGYYEQHPEYAPDNQSTTAVGDSVTPQTDSDGNVVTDADGQVVAAETDPQEYRVVTDDSGSIVYETDADGNKVAKTEKVVDTTDSEESDTDSASDSGTSAKTVAIVVGVILVCAGAAVIIFVFATRGKAKDDTETDEAADETGGDAVSGADNASDGAAASVEDEAGDAEPSDADEVKADENDAEAEKSDEK
jgi:hypothetical protein